MNFLLLSSSYVDISDANAICTRNLALELIKRGHNVSVISNCENSFYEKKEISGVDVYGVQEGLHSHSLKVARKKGPLWFLICRVLWACLSFFTYPKSFGDKRSKEIFDLAENLITSKNITHVVAVCQPYSNIVALLNLKSKYGSHIKTISYHLDLLQNPNNNNKFIYFIKRSKFLKQFQKEISLIDRILLPESCAEDFKSTKIIKTGFPVYEKLSDTISSEYNFPAETINVSYIGSFDKYNRNPLFVIELFRELTALIKKDVYLNIWGSSPDNEFTKLLTSYPNVLYHGRLDNKYVNDIYLKSDLILNIGNKLTYQMLPSKIFQIFATGMPIINVVQHPNDVSLKYFSEYGNNFNVKSFESARPVKELATFVSNASKLNKIKEFVEFTPSRISAYLEL